MGWLAGSGTVCLVGIERTGSYGAGLARHVTAAGARGWKWTARTVKTGVGRASPIRL